MSSINLVWMDACFGCVLRMRTRNGRAGTGAAPWHLTYTRYHSLLLRFFAAKCNVLKNNMATFWRKHVVRDVVRAVIDDIGFILLV